jgi:hypothetical protein
VAPVRRPVARDLVAVRAADYARRLPADRRTAFLRVYLACTSSVTGFAPLSLGDAASRPTGCASAPEVGA